MITNLLVGLNVPPVIVAAARAVLLAVATAAIGAAIEQAGVLDWGQFAYAAPFVIAGLRGLEGVIDQWLTPNQNDVPAPEAVIGEKSGTAP